MNHYKKSRVMRDFLCNRAHKTLFSNPSILTLRLFRPAYMLIPLIKST